MDEIKDESTSSFIQSQLHSVIASQRATIESLRESLTRAYVPRTDYDELLSRFEQSQIDCDEFKTQLNLEQTRSSDLENQLQLSNTLVNQLQTELNDVHEKLASTYAVLEQTCEKIDFERGEFDKSLKKVRRTTVDEIRKNSELYAKTLAMEQTYVAQRQALDTKIDEFKKLEKRLNKQEERATNRINKLAVKLEQEKFISREILQTNSKHSTKSKTNK